MGLVFLVDRGGGCLEAVPDALAELLGDGAVLLPLLVEVLQFLEGLDDILLLGQFLGGLAESGLHLEVLLEVEVAQVAVDLDHVVETLDVELVGVVDVAESGRRDGTDLAPAVLDLAESRESRGDVFLLFDEGLEVLDHGLFLHEVLLALLVELAVVLCALFLIRCI